MNAPTAATKFSSEYLRANRRALRIGRTSPGSSEHKAALAQIRALVDSGKHLTTQEALDARRRTK